MLSEFGLSPLLPEPPSTPGEGLSLDSAIARMKADLDAFADNYRRAAAQAKAGEDWPDKMPIAEWWEQWMCSGEGF